jgi:hypothetical protein
MGLPLVSRFRDDIREALDMEPEEPTRRGRDAKSLDELTSVELDSLSGAVMILLQDASRLTWTTPRYPDCSPRSKTT